MSNSNDTSQLKQNGFISKPALLIFKEIFFEPFKNQTNPEAKERECIDIYHYEKTSKANEKLILEREREKTYFLFDSAKNFYIFFSKNNFSIIDYKGSLMREILFSSSEKIISVSFNETNQYLFIVSRIASYLFEVNKSNYAPIQRDEKENFVGAFFIDSPEPMLEMEQKLCILYTNHFIITELNLQKDKKDLYNRKKVFHKNIKVDDYFFNQTYYILIIQSNNQFRLFNLKNNIALKQEMKLQVSDVTINSKFYLDIIYGKLYFIHVTERGVHLYLLNDLRQAIVMRPIDFDNETTSSQVHIQLCDNLILCYTPNNIGIYDIKQKNHKCIGVFEYESNTEPYDTIKHGQVAFYNNILFTNGRFFKLYFFKEYFYQTSSFGTKDTFFILFHRKKCKEIISKAIRELIVQFNVSNLHSIFNKISKHLDKKQLHKKIQYGTDKKVFNTQLKINDNYENDGTIMFFIKMPDFHHIITQDELFCLFDAEAISAALTPEKIIKLMMVVIDLLNGKSIPICGSFNKVFIKQINKMHSFAFIDCLIKSKSVLFNLDLGKCLIALGLNGVNQIGQSLDKSNMVLVYNLGLHMLMKLKAYNEIFMILIMNNQFNEAIEMIRMFKLTTDNISPDLEHRIAELGENEDNAFVMEQYLQN